jgi:hypothetical protein
MKLKEFEPEVCDWISGHRQAVKSYAASLADGKQGKYKDYGTRLCFDVYYDWADDARGTGHDVYGRIHVMHPDDACIGTLMRTCLCRVFQVSDVCLIPAQGNTGEETDGIQEKGGC